MAAETLVRGYGKTEAEAYAASRHGSDGAMFLDPYISSFLEYSRGENLLDVGGGTAKVGIEAVQRHGVLFVTSLDNSGDMLEQAEKAIWGEGLTDRISTRKGDVATLPVRDGSYRKISSVNVGCNLDNAKLSAHFQEMARVLSPDGNILFTAPINLGELFTTGNLEWDDLQKRLEGINAALLQAELSEQKIIQDNLKTLDDLLRATFVVQDHQVKLVVNDLGLLPENLRDRAVLENDITEGTQIWRKLPGLVVPNNYHSREVYEMEMRNAGFEIAEVYTDSFANEEERDKYNQQVEDPEMQLGKEYVGQGPFAVYILKKTEKEKEMSIPEQIAQTYITFREQHNFNEKPLGKRTEEELQSLSDQLQVDLAKVLGVEPLEVSKLRHIDPEAVKELAFYLRDGGTVLMRHGPQDTKATNKVDQMKSPANMQDPATKEGLVEFASTLLAIEYTLDNMYWAHPDQKISFNILSSRNQRALDVANVIGAVFNRKARIDDRLTCMDYTDHVTLGDPDLNPDGSVDWAPNKIDAVFGPGSYGKETALTRGVIGDAKTQEGNEIRNRNHNTQPPHFTLLIGHTQGTNAADTLAGRTPTRFKNYGSIVYPAGPFFTSFRMTNGIYR